MAIFASQNFPSILATTGPPPSQTPSPESPSLSLSLSLLSLSLSLSLSTPQYIDLPSKKKAHSSVPLQTPPLTATTQIDELELFAEGNAEDSAAGSKEYVHIRIQRQDDRTSLTIVQGLKKEHNYIKILKALRKDFGCNGTVVQYPELGQVVQLQGDHGNNVSAFLVQAGIVKKEYIKIHGL